MSGDEREKTTWNWRGSLSNTRSGDNGRQTFIIIIIINNINISVLILSYIDAFHHREGSRWARAHGSSLTNRLAQHVKT